MPTSKSILWFEELTIDDISRVGGKNASLGEMYRELANQGVRVPNGFAITAQAYHEFISFNHLEEKIRAAFENLNVEDLTSLMRVGHQVRQLILAAEFPPDMRDEILQAYYHLSENQDLPLDVAVRSSATAEDLPDASFAGQQETYLNVHGERQLTETCKRCFASLFTNRAISYREHHKFDHFSIGLSIGVQRMVRSDMATSGVMFSIDTESGFKDAVLINAAYGLGENVVQGSVNPDEYYVFKPTLMKGHRPILQKILGSKEFKMVYDLSGEKMTKNVPVPAEERRQFALSDEDILTLARWAVLIETHYSKKRNRPMPMDMEWAKDGQTGELFIVQARPETVQSRRELNKLETYQLCEQGEVLVQGRSVGAKIRSGRVRVIKDVRDLDRLQKGEVLVTEKTDPDWEPVMKRASAIITNRGGRTCHAAIVSRELGVPAIVGAEDATHILTDGEMVTVSCAQGEVGYVYRGELKYEVNEVNLESLSRPKTKIMMNVANPSESFHLSFIPNDGVGLAREEFIINDYIKIHPLALLNLDRVTPAERKQIDQKIAAYESPSQFFIDRLAEGVAMIAAAFYPKDVIVRLSDFKTNEYAHLIGGSAFEPKEENPMIGFRGASRYYHPSYKDAFALECQALKKVREDMGLNNLKIMVPFCRTPDEGRKVLQEMEAQGLRQGQNGLEIYVMCEIPSNVILADQFAEVFDGFSIGSNDLTQLTLGVDRDSEIIAELFDERNQAVKDMVKMAIQRAQKAGRKIGICGQAPSDYPEFAEFLVREGIDSLSLNPDSVLKTTQMILEVEASLY